MTVKELFTVWLAGNSLTEDILNAFVEKKLKFGRLDGKGGLSAKTVNDICVLVKSALKLARRKFQYAGAEEFRAPLTKQKPMEVLCEWESRRISAAVLRAPTPSNAAFLLCLETGIRLGEVCALRWSDVDFTNGLLHIRRTAYRINYGGRTELVIQTPKTDNSQRTIPLTAKMLSVLRSFRAGENDYLFTGSDKHMEPRTMQYRFQKFLKELGISHRNFHILRHSFATRCIDRGMDIKSLSEILGHANVQVTLQMYVHPSMDSKRSALETASVLSGIA